jgi:hypothetical protein
MALKPAAETFQLFQLDFTLSWYLVCVRQSYVPEGYRASWCGSTPHHLPNYETVGHPRASAELETMSRKFFEIFVAPTNNLVVPPYYC